MKHDFHFVLSNNLKNNICDFANARNLNLSEAVVYIFNFMKPLLEKHYLENTFCKEKEYSCFGAEIDMHVYFDKTDYKYLKQIQSNLYCFSMALILRWVLNVFFNGLSKYGFDFFSRLVNRFRCMLLRSNLKNNSINDFTVLKKQHMFSTIHYFQFVYHIFDHEYNLIKTKFT